jgi:predicted O-methyltransferase YrrM/tetratricopeptide (TPR) repeat protein
MSDVLMFDRIGGAFSRSSLDRGGLGGSEIEMVQVATALAKRGHRVVVANGIASPVEEDGVHYVPWQQAPQYAPTRAFYIQRSSVPEAGSGLVIVPQVRVIVRANDVYCPEYDVHRAILESGRAALVANTEWQANLFGFAKEKIVIPPMLGEIPKFTFEAGLFIYASGAMKGWDATIAMWRRLRAKYPDAMAHARLKAISPGWGQVGTTAATDDFAAEEATPEEYRGWIARAEGLFFVNTMPETFCSVAALAERAGTRTHILCRNGFGGIPEAVVDRTLITANETEFEVKFIEALSKPYVRPDGLPALRDLSPDALVEDWEKALGIAPGQSIPNVRSVEQGFQDDPSLAPNKEHLGPFFGDFLSLLRGAIAPGGSEFGLGLTLFSLAASTGACSIVEIGRFKGFSTLALAAALKLQDIGWHECKAAEQRPEIDYSQRLAPRKRELISIDPSPTKEADDLLERAGLTGYVRKVDRRSQEVAMSSPIDFLLIDGSHQIGDVQSDVQRFVPWVRPGGYFVLHDYFGWFDAAGRNGSPVAKVIAEDLQGFDRVLIDTGFASIAVFRKSQNMTEPKDLDARPEPVPKRADGRPTVGLCMIAKGDEASTVATRAILSAKRLGVDAITVVCDASEKVAEVARTLGADVYLRDSPKIDWELGNGVITVARNEALGIAERRTDYVLIVDADDWYEGALPEVLTHDFYEVAVHDGGMRYPRIQLFKSGKGYRYGGLIHEQLMAVGSFARATTLRYMRGQSVYGYQDRDPPAVKYSKHARLALKWLVDHPDDARMQFYLARSYHDAGRLDEALLEYEKRIAMMNGWDEERYYSAFQIGLIMGQQGKDPTAALLRAHELRPTRAEALVSLAQWHRDDARKNFSTAYTFARRAAEIPHPPGDALFINEWTYQFEALSEWAICAYWVGKKDEALTLFQEVLKRVPPDRRKWAETMIMTCRRELSGQAAQ